MCIRDRTQSIGVFLSKSKYTVLNTKDFVDNIKTTKAPIGYIAISFDVVSLFTNVPLRDTIDIILKKVYDEQLIKTKITWRQIDLVASSMQSLQRSFNVPDDAIRMCGEILINIDK